MGPGVSAGRKEQRFIATAQLTPLHSDACTLKRITFRLTLFLSRKYGSFVEKEQPFKRAWFSDNGVSALSDVEIGFPPLLSAPSFNLDLH